MTKKRTWNRHRRAMGVEEKGRKRGKSGELGESPWFRVSYTVLSASWTIDPFLVV